MPRDLNGEVSGCSKTVEREAATGLDSGKSQRTKSYNSRAEQRRGIAVGKGFRNGVREILRRHGVFGVSAVNGVAGERGMIAEIFHSGAAVFARAVGAMQPGDSNARADGESRRSLAELFDDADDLVPGNYWRLARRQFAFNDVQIGAADAAHFHADENFARGGLRHRRVGEFERIRCDRRGRMKQAGFHGQLSHDHFILRRRLLFEAGIFGDSQSHGGPIHIFAAVCDGGNPAVAE